LIIEKSFPKKQQQDQEQQDSNSHASHSAYSVVEVIPLVSELNPGHLPDLLPEITMHLTEPYQNHKDLIIQLDPVSDEIVMPEFLPDPLVPVHEFRLCFEAYPPAQTLASSRRMMVFAAKDW
jgi:hypothetical protein